MPCACGLGAARATHACRKTTLLLEKCSGWKNRNGARAVKGGRYGFCRLVPRAGRRGRRAGR
eukprot:4985766-Prymnesium_polylepis.1